MFIKVTEEFCCTFFQDDESGTEEYENQESQHSHVPTWSRDAVAVDTGTEATPIVIESSSEDEGGEGEEGGGVEQGFQMRMSEVNKIYEQQLP